MAIDRSLTSRRTGRLLAGVAATGVLGMAVATAIAEVEPLLHLYDGLWMIGGAVLAFAVVAPLVRRWPRDHAMALIAGTVAVGAWSPLVFLALRARIPVLARIKGAIFLSSADVIGVALPVGATLVWLALRDYRPSGPDRLPPTT